MSLHITSPGGYYHLLTPLSVSLDSQDLIADFTVEEAREYMRALLTALAALDVCGIGEAYAWPARAITLAPSQWQRLGIIHHDIKPANFLYCRRSRKCALVDFGLATAVGMFAQSRTLVDAYAQESRIDLGNILMRATTCMTDESCKERLEELKTKYHEERRRIRKRAGGMHIEWLTGTRSAMLLECCNAPPCCDHSRQRARARGRQ